ncbi:hypothetical protein EZV62_024603 [Acer yangbiense]|uniref:RNase H type-1 domain-containing protein n=1 Tax=Acer yangbiense TaxID=1000413 RepID=A0A5C7GVJ7_9ROSI|nr:hypothetical protein EZV62_024603 [Acer yangbiense]
MITTEYSLVVIPASWVMIKLPFYSEFMAVIIAIENAYARGWFHLWMKCDSVSVVQRFANSNLSSSLAPSYTLVILRPFDISRSHVHVHVSHIFREGKKNEFPELQSHNKIILEKETRNINNAKQNNNLHGEEFPTVRVTENANLMSPPAAPSVAVGDQSLPPPPPRHIDDFRPTAPGHSPGVGHSLQN